MAQLLLISKVTFKDGVNQIGDIVGIFEDSHRFSSAEHAVFTIVSVPNLTRDELLANLKTPEIQEIEDSEKNKIKMWRNSPDEPWKKLETQPKYPWTTAGLTQEQADIFQNPAVSKEVKIAALRQLGNNTSYQAENRATKVTITITEEPIE